MSNEKFAMKGPYRIGVDIGGTFTDLVMIDSEGQLVNEKVLTTPHDPSEGVLTGVSQITQKNGVLPAQVENIIHGTTLVANALIERKGVVTALLTTQGFRDVLQIAREWRYDIYDLFLTPVEPLVPRSLRFEVNERVAFDGTVIVPLDLEALEPIARQIREAGAQAVAICFLHSFRHDGHELKAKEILQNLLPNVTICISSEVMPEIGEYERTATAVCNAYVQPLFEKYISGLIQGLKSMGIQKDLYLMQSDGGTVHYTTAMAYPIRLVQSGPAGGVQATSLIGKMAGLKDVLCFDMGGTTAKACLINNSDSQVINDFEVARLQRFRKGSGIPLKVPAIDMIEIGSGGGSISRVNQLGLIQVGPDSSSAVPGPACYGQGGVDPTVTDADLILGYLDAGSFLGGDMRLDLAAASRAIETQIAQPLSLTLVDAAFGIHETVNEAMAQAASIHALEKGLKASNYAMVPIGGAGPVHACHVAMKLEIQHVLIPRGAGVASAFGFLASPMSFQFVKAQISTLTLLDETKVKELVEGLKKKGLAMMAHSGLTSDQCRVKVSAAMRYVGQGYEVEVPVDMVSPMANLADKMEHGFSTCYQQLYGRIEKDTPAEVVSWRVVVQGPSPDLLQVADSVDEAAFPQAAHALKGHRPVFCVLRKSYQSTPVYARDLLTVGAVLDGPAIIEERESTVVIPCLAKVTVDAHLNLRVDLPLQSS